jgi:cation transporter-like permease
MAHRVRWCIAAILLELGSKRTSTAIHLGVIDRCNSSPVAAERLVTIVAAIVVLWAIGLASLAITLPLDFWVTRANDQKPSSSSSARS